MHGEGSCECQACRKASSQTKKATGQNSQESEYGTSKKNTSHEGKGKGSLIKLLLVRFPAMKKKKKQTKKD